MAIWSTASLTMMPVVWSLLLEHRDAQPGARQRVRAREPREARAHDDAIGK